MNLLLSSGDEENGRPLLGGQGFAEASAAAGARGGAGILSPPRIDERRVALMSASAPFQGGSSSSATQAAGTHSTQGGSGRSGPSRRL